MKYSTPLEVTKTYEVDIQTRDVDIHPNGAAVNGAAPYKVGDRLPNFAGLPIEVLAILDDGYFQGAGGLDWRLAEDGHVYPRPLPPIVSGPTLEEAVTAKMQRAALWYAAHGWHVIPLHEPLFDATGKCTGCTCEEWRRQNGTPDYACPTAGKHPRIRDWEGRATTDETQIRKWWRAWPSANIGIAAGASGLVCVDADTYHAPEGGDLGIARADMETVTSLTGGGGEHLIYLHPTDGPQIRNDDKALPDWVNIRAHGGLFVAPPSLHASGNRYEWEVGYGPHDMEPAELPASLRELLQAADGRKHAVAIPERIAAGGRNNTLASLAGTMRRRGVDTAVIETALLTVNSEQCDPPLSPDEVKAIAKSVGKYPPSAKGPGDAATRLDDTGNSERFTAQHGDNVRYDHSTGHWYMWAGSHWRRDDDGGIQRLAKATARAIYEEAAAAAKAGSDEQAAQLSKWARTSAAESRRNAMLNLARAELPVAVTHDRFNRHDLLLNCLNGTLDLAAGQLRPHDRGDLLTYVLPVASTSCGVSRTLTTICATFWRGPSLTR